MNQPSFSSPSAGSPKRRALLAVIAIGVIIGATTLAYALFPTRTRAISAVMPTVGSPEMNRLVEAGRYVAVTGDCIACHSTPGGKSFAGGLAMATPIGTIYSTNITPDKATGIGNYTLDEFDRTIRHGIVPGGGTMYPAMPYPSYAKLTDDDTQALYAYFLHGVEPATAANRASDIVWPLSMRWPLAIWRKTFVKQKTEPPVGLDTARYADMSVARGAYLVQAAGHCGSCHTPRAATLQEKALDDSNIDYLSGGQLIDGWLAVNLRGNGPDGLGRWSRQDIVDTLKTARSPYAAVVGGPMSDVVTHSTQHMNDSDLQAIAAYLKTLKPHPEEPSKFVDDPATAKALQNGQDLGRGSQLYLDNCAACHRTDGKGYVDAFPTVAGNPTVLASDPTSLLRLILGGSELPSTAVRPSNLGMPAFDWRLSDEEVAQLATFVRQSWGNHASEAKASEVAKVRRHLQLERAHKEGGMHDRELTAEQVKR